MQALRQLGVGVVIAIVSVILVLGGIFLSLAESLPPLPTPSQIPPTLPLSFPTPTISDTPTFSLQLETFTPTEFSSLTPVVLQPTSVVCTPRSDWIRVTTTTTETIYSLAERYKTSADSLSAANCLTAAEVPAGFSLYVPPVPTITAVPCGPPASWVRGHVVQRGDTLFSIALAYRTNVQQLQRANCMGGSTTIYAGQRLYVPNVPTRTPIPGITVVPTFATETPTSTDVPPTNTVTIEPTPTSTATFTPTPTTTQVPVTP